jgi:glycosyltransferase involved in cell wall biosynthesis
MSKVSVVVPTFQRANSLPGLIAALEAQTLPASEFDVIIVDDASADDTPAMLADLAARARIRVRVLRNERNCGPGATRNNGWRASVSPVIAFTDDDCTPQSGWLEAGLRALDAEQAGIVQGRTLPDPSAPKRGFAKTVRVERLTSLYESCNIFYRADVLRDAGGFDESIRVPFGEDTAAGWEARRRGVRAVFAPDALVYHAVTYPGPRYWWRYAMMHRNFPLLVRRFPEMRRDLLWARVFLWRERAIFDAALAGLVGGFFWWPAFLLLTPYLYVRRPRALTGADVKSVLAQAAIDPAILGALVVGSIRERTLVL